MTTADCALFGHLSATYYLRQDSFTMRTLASESFAPLARYIERIRDELFGNEFCDVILRFLAVLSLLVNFLLIYLILHRHNRNLGNYRFLLVAFACSDITISMFHAYAVPILYQTEFGVFAFTITGLHCPYPLGFYINYGYIILFFEPFVLLACHFVYRYLVLVSPRKVHDHGPLLAMLAITFNMVIVFTLFAVCLLIKNKDDAIDAVMLKEFDVDMLSHPRPNVLSMHYILPNGGVNWRVFTAFFLSLAMALVTFGISGFCAFRFTKCISTRVMAIGARRLQLQLFRALLAQFAIPLIFCLIPVGLIGVLPLTGLRFGETGKVLAMMGSLFPVIDPIAIIFLIARQVAFCEKWLFSFRSMVIKYYRKFTGRIPQITIPLNVVSSTVVINITTTSSANPGNPRTAGG